MSMKINKLEIENVKRVRAVKMEPTSNGLTIIGGKDERPGCDCVGSRRQ